MMTCCKEKVVLVAVYEEKPKRRLTARNNNNIKHHHHHHHHHLHVHPSKSNKGNRRAELLSYSQHLRRSSKPKVSTPPRPSKSLVPSTTNDQETLTQVRDVQKKQKRKKQSGGLDMNSIFKCFAMSHAKRKVKKKTSSESTSNKANVIIMKNFNARTQKGARRFFSKLKAIIQKYM